MRKALVISHVAFEDLGSVEIELWRAGFAIEMRDAAICDLRKVDFMAPDLDAVLNGLIGVYEEEAYPFLRIEIDALQAQRPTLGVCLGAQIMAAAGLERWYVGRAFELARSGIDVRALRAERLVREPALEAAARRFWRRWIKETSSGNASRDSGRDERRRTC